jgi:hypothetical protein
MEFWRVPLDEEAAERDEDESIARGEREREETRNE